MYPSQEFSFHSSKLLSKSQFFPFSNFNLILNNNKYTINPIIASTFSELIRSQIFQDPFFDELSIKIPEGNYNELISYLIGKEISINSENSIFLLESASILGIPSLISNILTFNHSIPTSELYRFSFLAFSKGFSIKPFIDEFKLKKSNFDSGKTKNNSFRKAFVDSFLKFFLTLSIKNNLTCLYLDLILKFNLITF